MPSISLPCLYLCLSVKHYAFQVTALHRYTLPVERAALATPQAHLEFLVFHMREEETKKPVQSVTRYLFLVVKPGHLTKFSTQQVYSYSIRAYSCRKTEEKGHQGTVFKLKALKYTNVCTDTCRGRQSCSWPSYQCTLQE